MSVNEMSRLVNLSRFSSPFALHRTRKKTFRQNFKTMSHSQVSYIDTAIHAAKSAGKVISEAFSRPKNIQNKGIFDLVTETDKECERLIKDAVKKAFPDHVFIGEESAAANGLPVNLTDAPTWMCDPLDGTTNFVHQYPSCCVSIALWMNRQPELGVVYNPVLQELFSAEKGKGAFLNGQRIHTSSTKEMEQAVFATELGVVREPAVIQAIFDRVAKIALVTRSVRCGGSIALDLCNVACGRLDFCYEIEFGGCWDVGAGSLIVMEAGGNVLDPCGGSFNIMARRVLGANAFLGKEVATLFSSFEFYPDEPRPQIP